ncbi:MAG TPA: M20 family metallopeptidase [Casimicrobiaceae bacterium]|nr:M20 family metallopeptidase [Casimicrobiaceae bacterium]
MTIDVRELHRRLEGKREDMLALLERLVNIDSGSYCKAGVDRVASVIGEELARSGFDVARRPMSDSGDQIVAIKRLRGRGRLLVLGHADTVWPEGTVREWPYRAQDGFATGPGVGDMKGGLVMAIFALRELFAAGFDGLESIRFFLVPDEELGSIHSRESIEDAAREADFALVLEPGRPGGGLVTARGAVGAFFMHARGQTAHCATSYANGASAVRELALKVPALEALSDAKQGRVVNVGVFRGGAARQVIPGEAKIDIDVRARTAEQAAELVQSIRDIASDCRDPRVMVELSGRLTRPPFTAANNASLFAMARSIAAELGITVFEVEPTGGGSDGNFAAALGVPTLDALGPVSTDVCSRRESMSIASLIERAALFAGIVQSLTR